MKVFVLSISGYGDRIFITQYLCIIILHIIYWAQGKLKRLYCHDLNIIFNRKASGQSITLFLTERNLDSSNGRLTDRKIRSVSIRLSHRTIDGADSGLTRRGKPDGAEERVTRCGGNGDVCENQTDVRITV